MIFFRELVILLLDVSTLRYRFIINFIVKYRIHGLISISKTARKYVLNTQYALSNEIQKLTTPSKP